MQVLSCSGHCGLGELSDCNWTWFFVVKDVSAANPKVFFSFYQVTFLPSAVLTVFDNLQNILFQEWDVVLLPRVTAW